MTRSAAAVARPSSCHPGWYGRPYDNHHALTRVGLEADDELLVVLDNTQELRLAGPTRAAVNGRELRLDGFSRGGWSWTEYFG